MTNYLRSCSECNAHILTGNGVQEHVRCAKCEAKRPSFDRWAATIEKGSRVYVQPVLAEAFSRSQWLVIDREGDSVTVQVVGLPQTRMTTTIGQLASENLTPRPRYAL